MVKIGDFSLASAALGAATEKHGERSERAQATDEANRAPVTTSFPAWEDNPDRLDFPGVDTPAESPGVLPKDLMDRAPTQTTKRARDEAPIAPMGTEDTFQEMGESRLRDTDVSLSPDEAFRGVGATSPKAAGGFDMHMEGERRPSDEVDYDF